MTSRKNAKNSTRFFNMSKKLIFIIMTMMLLSCSTTVINVEKNYFIISDEDVIISGSELKDNAYNQESKPDIKIPLPSGF